MTIGVIRTSHFGVVDRIDNLPYRTANRELFWSIFRWFLMPFKQAAFAAWTPLL